MTTKPKGRTLAEFRPLKPAEEKLLAGCAKGELADINASRPDKYTDSCTVRADFIRFLALGGDDDAPVHETGLQLKGAWIKGALNLRGCAVPSSLQMIHAHFETAPDLSEAEINGRFDLRGSWVPRLQADGLRCKHHIFLTDGFTAASEVRLLGAQIGGDLDCSGANFEAKKGVALCFDRANIQGSVFLIDGFTAQGKVRLLGARIGGQLNCSGAKLKVETGSSLSFDHATIQGDVSLNDGFTAIGTVRLLGAQIGGSLNCHRAQIEVKEGNALCFDRANIQGDVLLINGFSTQGTVKLLGAQIGGNLDCPGAQLEGNGGDALFFDDANIQGNVFLIDGFSAQGTVRLVNAQIGGSLKCSGAKLDSRDGFTLAADGMCVEHAFFFHGLRSPANRVSLASAKVGQLIDDAKAWGDGLVLDGFVYGHLTGHAPTDAKTRLAWLSKQRQRDPNDPSSFWPQPWKQLQKVLNDMGHTQHARKIGSDFETKKRQTNWFGKKTNPLRWMHWLFGVLVDYGYRPMRLVNISIGVWLACAAFFWYAALEGVMGPSNPLVFQNPELKQCKPNWYLCEALPEEYTGFSPLTYSLDVLLPVVNLQQETDWAPLVPTPLASWWGELWSFSLKHWTRIVIWAEVLYGWLATLLLVAVLSGLVKKDGE